MICRVCKRPCDGSTYWDGDIFTRVLADECVPRATDGTIMLCHRCQRGTLRDGFLPFVTKYLSAIAAVSEKRSRVVKRRFVNTSPRPVVGQSAFLKAHARPAVNFKWPRGGPAESAQ